MAVETFNINFTTSGKNILLSGIDSLPFGNNTLNHTIIIDGGVVGVGEIPYEKAYSWGSPDAQSEMSMTQAQTIDITEENYEIDRIQYAIKGTSQGDIVIAEIIFSPARVFEFGGIVNINSLMAAIKNEFV